MVLICFILAYFLDRVSCFQQNILRYFIFVFFILAYFIDYMLTLDLILTVVLVFVILFLLSEKLQKEACPTIYSDIHIFIYTKNYFEYTTYAFDSEIFCAFKLCSSNLIPLTSP